MTTALHRLASGRSLAHRVVLAVLCLAVSFLPGIFGSRFSPGEWYAQLDKPWLTPPGWVFGVAWPVLYVMMGIALYLFITTQPRPRRLGLGLALFGIQLVSNGAWSWIFFGLQRPGLALLEIVALWLAILATLVVFARARAWAGALLAPYLGWVTFASYLNLEIWRRATGAW